MNLYRRQLLAAIEAIDELDESGFTWCGRRYETEAVAPELARRLYESFFVPGSAIPSSDTSHRSRIVAGWTPLAHRLAEANAGRWSLQRGWQVVSRDDGILTLRKGNHHLYATADDVVPITPGAVAVRFPSGLVDAYPGYFVAIGERDLTPDAPMVRIYWNISARHAPALLATTTDVFNRADIAFRAKFPNLTESYGRTDAVVLYTYASRTTSVLELTRRVYRRFRGNTQSGIPALTAYLADGLAYAFDPPGSESFGGHRCRLIAEGLVAAAVQDPSTPTDLLEAVAERFQREGVSIDAPYTQSIHAEAA